MQAKLLILGEANDTKTGTEMCKTRMFLFDGE